MYTKILIDTGYESWDSPKEQQMLVLQFLPGRAEWILKRNCLTRLKRSSTKTSPIRSASTVPGGMSC
jgi:hypothetical protein